MGITETALLNLLKGGWVGPQGACMPQDACLPQVACMPQGACMPQVACMWHATGRMHATLCMHAVEGMHAAGGMHAIGISKWRSIIHPHHWLPHEGPASTSGQPQRPIRDVQIYGSGVRGFSHITQSIILWYLPDAWYWSMWWLGTRMSNRIHSCFISDKYEIENAPLR